MFILACLDGFVVVTADNPVVLERFYRVVQDDVFNAFVNVFFQCIEFSFEFCVRCVCFSLDTRLRILYGLACVRYRSGDIACVSAWTCSALSKRFHSVFNCFRHTVSP